MSVGHHRVHNTYSALEMCCAEMSAGFIGLYGGVAALQTNRWNQTEHCWTEKVARIKRREGTTGGHTARKEQKELRRCILCGVKSEQLRAGGQVEQKNQGKETREQR